MKAIRLEFEKRLLKYRLKSFEKRLTPEKVAEKKVENLFLKLSHISKKYKQLQQRAPFLAPDLMHDLDRIVNLYGHIISLNQEHEVSLIQKRAEKLQHLIDSAPMHQIAHEIDQLKQQMHLFCRDNRPSKECNEILWQARKAANMVEEILMKKYDPTPRVAMASLEDGETLFEIAFLYRTGNPQQGREMICALPLEVKKVMTTFIEENPLAKTPQAHSLRMQQAAVRTGLLILDQEGADRFLTPQELTDFFKERTQLRSSCS